MSTYRAIVNPFTGDLTLVRDDSVFHVKDSVATYNDLPITGNSENNVRIAQDTDKMYTWGISSASGSLSDWKEIGSVTSIDWSAINNKPSSSVADIDDAVTKKHAHANSADLDNVSGTNTGDETTTTLGSKINAADAKSTPVDADMVGLMDSAASNILKKLSWTNIKATLKLYFDTLYSTLSLNNLSGVAINTSLISDTDSTDDLGSSSKCWKDAYIDKVVTPAIKFPATQIASADANTLDDYEEGTWTPVLTFATPGDLNVVYSIQYGSYTKIGRNVTVQCYINTSTFTHTTASGDMKITGLPFVSATGYSDNVGSLRMTGLTKANYTQFYPLISGTSSVILIYGNGSGQSSATMTIAEAPTGTQQRLVITINYRV